MKYIVFIFITIFAVAPTSVFAACSETGATVVFVNGVLNSENDAKESKNSFQKLFQEKTGSTDVKFILAYNPSHLAGAGDVMQSAAQMLDDSISDHDLNTILMQIQPDVTTRKILLVGHSQGTFYTNTLYRYLTTHGVPKESIAVYNVATPAGEVAANGDYLTSSNDSLIRSVTWLAQKLQITLPLSANIDIPIYPNDAQSAYPGHNFIYAYLAGASDRIVSDVARALNALTAQTSAEICFTAPQPTVAHQAAGIALAAADFTIRYVVVSPVNVAQTLGTYIGNTTVAIAGAMKNAGSSLWTFLSSVPTSFLSAQLSGLIGANEQPAPTFQPTPLPQTVPQPLLQPISLQLAAPQPQPQAETATITNSIVPVVEVLSAQDKLSTSDVDSFEDAVKSLPLSNLLTSDVGNTEIEAPAPVYHGSGSVTGVSLDAVAILPPIEESIVSFSETSATTDTTATSTPDTVSDTATSTEEVIITATSTEPVIVVEPEVIDGPPIVINEIAWMGTNAHYSDEWIELYNKTNSDIDLSGWTLESRNKAFSVLLSQKIPAQGYFLLERTATTTTDQMENMIFTGAIADSGPEANLYLKQGTTTIDHIDFGSWPFANKKEERRSLERVSPYATSTNSYNWKTYSDTLIPPFAKDGDVLGTPGAKNSVTGYYVPAWHVMEDTVWRKKYSPYYVPPFMLEVRNGATLTIEPGVVVKFAKDVSSYGGGMDVHGVLRAEGTMEEPIIFTSFLDDAVDGVDSNQDGSATSPAPADWMNVNFYSTTTPSVIAHAQVRYGGQGRNNNPNGWYPAHTGVFGAYGANPQIADSLFEHNYATSLYMKNGAHPHLARTTIKNTMFHPQASAWMSGFGIRIADASSTADIIGNVFEDNTVGISSESATSTPLIVKDNIFTRNQRNGDFNSSYGDLNVENTNNQDSEHKGGFYIYLVARDGQVKTLHADAMPYIVRGGITVEEGGALAIETGTVIKNAANQQSLPVPVVVRGVLKAQGTPDKPIVFTAFTDDSDGYDSDNSAGTPASGSWKNIQFIGATSSDSILEYVTIRYGGSGENLCPYAYFGGPCMGYKGALLIQDASPTIAHATFDKNLAIAAYVEGGAQPIIAYSDFRDTKQAIKNPRETIGGIGISIGAESTPVLTDNTFTNNNEDVVYRP